MAEDMIHYEKYSVVRGHVRVTLDLSRYASRFPAAQARLGELVLQSCRSLMPLRTGNIQQRSHTEPAPLRDRSSVENGGRQVVFPGPYARYLYMGKVMVDPETRSAWAREGVKKVVTDRDLTFERKEAVAHWFEAAKQRDCAAWVRSTQDYIRTGRG